MRKLLFWIHLVAGSLAGIVILIMSATGVLLTYEKQMVQWNDRKAAEIQVPPGSSRVTIEGMIDSADKAGNSRPETVTIRRNPQAPVEASFGREKTLLIDPYTAQVRGEAPRGMRQFFQKVTAWHRWLGATGDSRSWSKQVTGACNLAFVFLALSGLYLWWPRAWTPAAMKVAFVPQTGLTAKARDFNWHNAFGFWAAIPLVVVAGTATVMSYSWANELLFSAFGEKPPTRQAPAGREREREGRREGGAQVARVRENGRRPAGPRGTNPNAGESRGGERGPRAQRTFEVAGLNPLLEKAAQQDPNWQAITVRLAGPTHSVTFQIDSGNGGQPQKRSTLELARTGEVLKFETFGDQTPGRRARSWFRFLHTGEALGLGGQTVAGLASLAGVVLVWTGLSLALRRFARWRKRGSATAATQTGAKVNEAELATTR
jgi:uncharacterized iron-regulated membrane protein